MATPSPSQSPIDTTPLQGRWLSEAVIRRPRTTLAGAAIVTVVLSAFATGVELDSSIESLLPTDHPALIHDREVKENFDSREMVLLGVVRGGGVLRPGTLARIDSLVGSIQSLDLVEPGDAQALARAGHAAGAPYNSLVAVVARRGLTRRDTPELSRILADAESDSAGLGDLLAALRRTLFILKPVSDIISLTEVDDITDADGTLRVGPLISEIPSTEAELDDLTRRIFANPMYVRGLVSADTTATAILVELSFHYDRHVDLAHRLFDRLEALTDAYVGPEKLYLAGVPMVNVYTSNYMRGDMQRLMPVVVLVVLLVTTVAVRSWRLAALPVALVGVALLWTVGSMALLGRPFTLVVSAMPVILIAVGVADGIHLLTEYRSLVPEAESRAEAVRGTMDVLTRPILFTSLTDIAGFGSLAISPLASIRDFGIFTALGVFAALVLSLTALPAALLLLPAPKGAWAQSSDGEAQSPGPRMVNASLRRRRLVMASVVVLALGAGLSATRLNVGSTMVGYFKEGSEIYRSSALINELFGGTEVLNIVIDTGEEDGLKRPHVLQGIATLQAQLAADTLVGHTISVADYVLRIDEVLGGGPPGGRIPSELEARTDTVWAVVDGIDVPTEERYSVPGQNIIAQYMLLFENAGGTLDELADLESRKANIVVQIRTDHTPSLRKIKDAAEAFVEAQMGPEVVVTFAGCSFLCIVADDLIIPGQVRSLALATGVVLVLLTLIFGTARLGLVGVLPLVITVLSVFGLMGVFGVYLDAVTALIASIVLGVGIDYSVHFLSRFQTARASGNDVAGAIRHTAQTTGRAIAFNSVAVSAGFLVLLFSSFWPIINIGWLVAVTMTVGALLTTLLLPAVLLWLHDLGLLPPPPTNRAAR